MPQETIELFYDDLSREKQQEILKLFKIKSPDEISWDVFPIAVVCFEIES